MLWKTNSPDHRLAHKLPAATVLKAAVLKNASYNTNVEKPAEIWRMLFTHLSPLPFGLSFSWSHFLNQRFPSSSKHFITTNLSCAYLFPVFTQQIMAKKGQEEGVYNGKIINTDMPSLPARQSLAAQERTSGASVCSVCDCLPQRLKLLWKTSAGACSSSPAPAQGIQCKPGS